MRNSQTQKDKEQEDPYTIRLGTLEVNIEKIELPEASFEFDPRKA